MLILFLFNIDVVPCDTTTTPHNMVVTLHDTTIAPHVSSTYLLPFNVVVAFLFNTIVVPPVLD
jgi:hypothetical protein